MKREKFQLASYFVLVVLKIVNIIFPFKSLVLVKVLRKA
jgi:hypothetical protein